MDPGLVDGLWTACGRLVETGTPPANPEMWLRLFPPIFAWLRCHLYSRFSLEARFKMTKLDFPHREIFILWVKGAFFGTR